MAVFGNPDVTVVMGVSLAGFRQQMAGVRTAFLVAIPLALLGIAAGSWLIAARALRPVRRLSETLARVSARGLDQRVPETKESAEFQQLVCQFNGMMERLERSFTQAARFSADAAHELKTPLTVLQGEIEQALQEAPPQQQQTYARLLDEVQRLKIITEKLLLLARADAGQLRIQAGPFDLSAAVSELAEDAAALAAKLTIAADISPDVWIHADRDLLPRALHNVIDNAIKYNRDGGLIRIELRQIEGAATCRISNTGDIPRDRRDKVFDRFVRVDAARSRRVDGSGLGLSLAREIVRAHGGELALAAVENGMVTFELKFNVIAPRNLPPSPHTRFPIGSHQEARHA
ncbi:MAG: two-component sensor histidine kinase [Candidatus Hydrogenedentota bacterium]